MKEFPNLKNISYQQKQTLVFGGINKTNECAENEFSDMLNMSSDGFPCLQTRAKRKKVISPVQSAKGNVFAFEKLGFLKEAGGGADARELLYYGGDGIGQISHDAKTAKTGNYIYLTDGKKVLDLSAASPAPEDARFAAELTQAGTVIDDGSGYSTYDFTTLPFLMLRYTDGNSIVYGGSDSSGEAFPSEPSANQLFYNTTDGAYYRCISNGTTTEWRIISKLRLYLYAQEGVSFAGLEKGAYINLNMLNYIVNTTPTSLTSLDGYYTVATAGTAESSLSGDTRHYIAMDMPISAIKTPFLILGECSNCYGSSYNPQRPSSVYNRLPVMCDNIRYPNPPEHIYNVLRDVPTMDYICSSNNRIWGCSGEKHEIYACEQGNPRNWYKYEGIASDSYTATVGSDGDFTGCINYLGTVIFFKENEMIKVNGTRPANYTLSYYSTKGVARGADRSLVIESDILYYKARDGIYAYSQSTPRKISDALGDELNLFSGTVTAGSYRGKLYFAFGNKTLCVYDIENGIWEKESLPECSGVQMITLENELLLCISEKDGTTERGLYFYTVSGNSITTDLNADALSTVAADEGYERDIQWSCITPKYHTVTPEGKYLRRMDISASITGSMSIAVRYDSGTMWENVKAFGTSIRANQIVRFTPRRCDHFEIKLSGVGSTSIYSITETYEEAYELGRY